MGEISEDLLFALAVKNSGGGGGGTSNYNQLENLPQIGGVTLRGNKSASDLGLASATALANKVDKENGKGLSTNDYTSEDKAIVAGVTTALSGKQDALTVGQYIDIDNDEISVKRDIARDVDAIITTSFDFPNCTVTKTIDEEVVDTVTFSMFGDIPSSVLDVYSVSFNSQAVVLTFTNTVASKEHAVGYTFQVASYSSGVIDTQTFVETLDADKKLIIQSELDSAVAGKVDKVNGKGLSANDFTDEYKAAIGSNTSAIAAIKDGSELDSFGDVEVALLDKADISDLGTAAAKDSTNSVTAGSTDLVESGAVKDAIDAAVAAAYHHAGTKTVAQLTHDLLIAANEGNVYNITDSGTTTSDFIEGIGKQIDAGDNVGICKVGNVYMFDLLSGLEDTSIFVQKSQTAGLFKNDGTVNTTIEDTVAGHTTAIAGKQDKYDTITYAQWQAMTPEQQAAKDYYISDYPSSVLTAGNIAYDNTTSGMAANKVQGAVDGEIVAVDTGVTVYRQGRMRILKLYGAVSASTGIISELSASDRPLVQTLCPCVYNDGTTKSGYIIIETTGEIKLLDVDADTYVNSGRAFSMISYYIL